MFFGKLGWSGEVIVLDLLLAACLDLFSIDFTIAQGL